MTIRRPHIPSFDDTDLDSDPVDPVDPVEPEPHPTPEPLTPPHPNGSSDTTDPRRVSTELLETLIGPRHVNTIQQWEASPYDLDIGATTVRDNVFGKLGLPVIYNNEAIIGGHIVEAERIDPKDNGMVVVIDVTSLEWGRSFAEAAALGEFTAIQQAFVDHDALADLVTRLHEEDPVAAVAAGWDGDALDALLQQIDEDRNTPLDGDGGGDLVSDDDSIPEPTTGPARSTGRVMCGFSARTV